MNIRPLSSQIINVWIRRILMVLLFFATSYGLESSQWLIFYLGFVALIPFVYEEVIDYGRPNRAGENLETQDTRTDAPNSKENGLEESSEQH